MRDNSATIPGIVDDNQAPAPLGSAALRNEKQERYCRERALLRSRIEAYRAAGFESVDVHTARGNAARLERRQDVRERIAWLSQQDEQLIREKRRRLEAFLWTVHDARIGDVWETVEIERRDKDGNLVLGADGKPVMKRYQRPKLTSDVPDELQVAIENYALTEDGRAIPKLYSKMSANQELRKFLGLGAATRGLDSDEWARMSDGELLAELRRQAIELQLDVTLTYEMRGDGT